MRPGSSNDLLHAATMALLAATFGGCGALIGIDGLIFDRGQPTSTGGGGPGGGGGQGAGGGAGAGGAGTAGAAPCSTLGVIQGKAVDTHLLEGLNMGVDEDLGGAVVAAHVPQPTGGYVVHPGMGVAGSFEIPDVPDCPYLLQIGTEYWFIADRKPDLGIVVLGEPGPPAMAGTSFQFNGVGVHSWDTAGELQMFSIDVGMLGFELQNGLDTAPMGTDTQITSGLVYDAAHGFLNPTLIQSHRLTMVQLISRTIGTYSYKSAVAALNLEAYSMSNGGSNLVQGGFIDGTPQTAHLKIQASAFGALAGSLAPGVALFIDPVPGPETGDHGFYGGAPNLVSFSVPAGLDLDDPFTFTDPMVAKHANVVLLSAAVIPGWQLPGTTSPSGSSSAVSYFDLLKTVQGHPADALAPPFGAPSMVKIDGLDFSTPGQMLSLHPTVSWANPDPAFEKRYTVAVNHLRPTINNASTKADRVATLTTPNTSIELPDGILVAGEPYGFYLETVHMPSVDRDRAPRKEGFPRYQVSIASAIFNAP